MAELVILHTNDLHSHMTHWPRIARWLREQREAALARGAAVLVLDDGDAMDRVHPLTEATDGQFNIEQQNAVGYDAVTIGNNEGVGNSHDVLTHLYDHAKFPVALANLFEADGRRPRWARPVVRKTLPDGTRVAILGFTAPFFLTYAPNGWQVKPVEAVLPDLLQAIGGSYDVLIVLSHLGITADRYLAAHFPEIDVIIGGHTHHLLAQGELDGRTLVTAAGKHGQYVGEIHLQLDATHQITERRAQTHAFETLPSAPGDAAQIAAWQAQGIALLQARPVARLPREFRIDYNGASALRQLGLSAVAAGGGTQAALLNAGLFLHDLPAGIVTQADLHALLPHAMHLMRITLRGTDLWRLVMEIEKNRHFLRHFHLVGMSFRGDIFGDMGLLGLQVTPKRQVLYAGQPLVPEQQYTITGLDHYLFIPFFPTIEIVGENQLLFPKLLRTVFAEYLAAHYPIS
ncbi:MAG: 5'-nucleotidase C-terminal domain-containing protein [Lactobacillus sp.]|jgi:2',3'-cyclic-nucleotide 2'-phosphodiesterase (5'-nucleotidase family)|nr:5'-nucleotidase C-terminal domain-containing protein [Lactobacillus sp.]MCI2033131.1 5'-nucleotidase C-terminal domain-containing protein [Lactobacillus sp.]